MTQAPHLWELICRENYTVRFELTGNVSYEVQWHMSGYNDLRADNLEEARLVIGLPDGTVQTTTPDLQRRATPGTRCGATAIALQVA
jgi:hypothetical protein